jgi:hypothetical protein
MHSFSPLRFNLAKQVAFAVSKTSRSHAAVSIGPLEKNLHPASGFADLRCVAFRDAHTQKPVGYFGKMTTPNLCLAKTRFTCIFNNFARHSPSHYFPDQNSHLA